MLVADVIGACQKIKKEIEPILIDEKQYIVKKLVKYVNI